MKDILLKFVSIFRSRYAIAAPFTIGEFTYATCGRMIIRVPKVEGFPGNDGFPQVENVYKQFPTGEVEWSPCPIVSYEKEMEGCKKCNGSGRHDCTVEDCFNYHGCHWCDESGYAEKLQTLQVGHRLLNLEFLSKIAALPKAELAIHHGGKLSAIAFRFEGGDGLLMPVKGDE